MVNRSSSLAPDPSVGFDALTVIRQATASCHSELENAVDWRDSFSSPKKYAELLRGFWRVVQPLEARLQSYVQPNARELVGWRADCLRRDIVAVQEEYGSASAVEPADSQLVDIPFVNDWSTAFGSLYVLEGSALGGQILSRHLRACAASWPTLDVTSPNCAEQSAVIDSYFVGRGAGTALHWHSFCQHLKHELPELDAARAAAQAAVKTFECFHLSLSGKSECVRS